MDSSTTISQMFSGNTLYVPTYQRAYSWDTGIGTNKMPKQVNQFIIDFTTVPLKWTNRSLN